MDFSESYITIGATLTTSADNQKGLTSLEAFNRPEVVFAVPGGSWSEAVAKEVAPTATMKVFGQSTSADLIQEVIAKLPAEHAIRAIRITCMWQFPLLAYSKPPMAARPGRPRPA